MPYVFAIGSMLFIITSFMMQGPLAMLSIGVATMLICTCAILNELAKGRKLHEKSNS